MVFGEFKYAKYLWLLKQWNKKIHTPYRGKCEDQVGITDKDR